MEQTTATALSPAVKAALADRDRQEVVEARFNNKFQQDVIQHQKETMNYLLADKRKLDEKNENLELEKSQLQSQKAAQDEEHKKQLAAQDEEHKKQLAAQHEEHKKQLAAQHEEYKKQLAVLQEQLAAARKKQSYIDRNGVGRMGVGDKVNEKGNEKTGKRPRPGKIIGTVHCIRREDGTKGKLDETKLELMNDDQPAQDPVEVDEL